MDNAAATTKQAGEGRKKKIDPKGIIELLGIALGCIGLTYDDFCKLSYEEFAAVYEAFATQRDTDFKDNWSRMRLLATISIQPHLGKGKKLTPEKLLPFPWDNVNQKPKNVGNKEELTPEQKRKRMAELVKKLDDTII